MDEADFKIILFEGSDIKKGIMGNKLRIDFNKMVIESKDGVNEKIPFKNIIYLTKIVPRYFMDNQIVINLKYKKGKATKLLKFRSAVSFFDRRVNVRTTHLYEALQSAMHRK